MLYLRPYKKQMQKRLFHGVRMNTFLGNGHPIDTIHIRLLRMI